MIRACESIRNHRVHRYNHCIRDPAIELPVGVAIILSARRIRGGRCDAGQFQRKRIDEGRVTASMGHHHRMIRDRRIQIPDIQGSRGLAIVV